MPFTLPRLYPITDTKLSTLSPGEQVRQLIAGGASLVQVRGKEMNSRELLDAAKAAVEVAHRAGAKLIVNDRADLAVLAGADGVHLGQDDLPPEAARRVVGPDAIVGYSTHNLTQARAAAVLPIDYLAIGPIFPTGSKLNPDPVVGLDGLRAVRDTVPHLPLVAIGGIDAGNARSVLDAGADSVAVISALLRDPRGIEIATRALIEMLRQ